MGEILTENYNTRTNKKTTRVVVCNREENKINVYVEHVEEVEVQPNKDRKMYIKKTWGSQGSSGV